MWKTVIILVLVYLIIKNLSSDKATSKNKEKTKVKGKKNNNKVEHYREKGLDDKDISIFRETMKEARDHIKYWEEEISRDEKLVIIEEETQGLFASKKTFQAIVEEPAMMTKEDTFLYRDLPNMTTLVKKYRQLSAVKPVSQEVKLELAERLHYIMKLSEKISKNYQASLIDDVDDIKYSLREEEIHE
ncbi:5-bromo-4-chloroindolyl phosphate hydrolysis family protein [Streptococcaceae bacterium ESL0729]|nr:5-bromo-4-chloroindolyl phosphate hydrolysis family protein [Streptococcaceae bacterium ESL0729]